MPFRIGGWPERHPHLTKVGGYPFGYSQPTSPNPLLDIKGDGYASSFNELYSRYRRKATKKKREFTLTKPDFYLLTSQPCYYCAAPPSRKVAGKYKNPYIFNGIDRYDSAKGYTLRNCFGCCWEHNRMKGTLSFQEFYRQSLVVTLSISSRTALDIGDLQCMELLIKLYPHVPFLKEHRLALLEDRRLAQVLRSAAGSGSGTEMSTGKNFSKYSSSFWAVLIIVARLATR
jgi:hypothetical protein